MGVGHEKTAMDLYGVASPDAATIRFYLAGSEEDARQQYEHFGEYKATLHVIWLTRTTVLLRGMQSDVLITRAVVTRICRLLVDRGVTDVIAERAPHRRMPWGAMIDSGPLKGLWHAQPVLVLAGQGGDY